MTPALHTIYNVPIRAWKALWPLGRITGLTMLLGLGTYYFIVLPAEESLHSLHVAHQQERKQFMDLREQRKIQKEFIALKKQLRKVWNILPAQKEFTNIALTISQLANAEKVLIPSMTYSQKTVSKELPLKASLSFSATGTYPSIYRFIHHLEQSKQYLIIERINVTRTNSSREPRTSRVRFNMKVSTFLKKVRQEEKST